MVRHLTAKIVTQLTHPSPRVVLVAVSRRPTVVPQAIDVPTTYQIGYRVGMATEQIAVRLPTQLLAELDALVARGEYDTRAAAVRAGIEQLASRERGRRLDREIVDGYHRLPPTEVESEAALASLRDAIAEEPW